MFTGIGEKETQISSLLPWNAQRAIMSNIAPYNEKKEEEKRKPIMNRNEPLTKCKPKREKKKMKKSTHVADSVTVSMSGVFPLSFVSATVLHSGHTDLAITHSTAATTINPCILSLNLQQC